MLSKRFNQNDVSACHSLVVVAICYNLPRISHAHDGTIWHHASLRIRVGHRANIAGTAKSQRREKSPPALPEEESELALLAQFMRHDSVASLANAIAKRTGARSGDLIAAAGLDPSRAER
jgi:hypothetical protein